MKQSNIKGTIIWVACLVPWVFLLAYPPARSIFLEMTTLHPYGSSFVKFFILASMGDLLGLRIMNGKWSIPRSIVANAFIWGILGMCISLAFSVFGEGVDAAQEMGKLPFYGVPLAHAFFSSAIMNVTFGPMLYVYHAAFSYGVKTIGQKEDGSMGVHRRLSSFAEWIDWKRMVGFSWFTSCLFLWIPLHTLVFLLPPEYRVLASASLSILFGALVSLSQKRKSPVVLSGREAAISD